MNIERVIAGDATMEAFVAHALSATLWKESGYEPDEERIQRIADGAERLMREGYSAEFAYKDALFEELIMNGDPLA